MLHYLNVSSIVTGKKCTLQQFIFLLECSESRGQILKLVLCIFRPSKDSMYKYSHCHHSEKIKVRTRPVNPQNKGRESSPQWDGAVPQCVIGLDLIGRTGGSELAPSTV